MGKLTELLSAPYADHKGIRLESTATWTKNFSYLPTIAVLEQHNPEKAIDTLSLRFSDQRFCHNLSSTTYIHTYNFICFSRLQKKAAYADVDLLKTYLKYLQHLIGLILQITLKYL